MTRSSRPPVAIYSALADATRCRIVEILLAGPIPVHHLADNFSISRPAISRHLRVLKTAGLVAEVKKGRENVYALRTAKLGPAAAWLEKLSAPVSAGGKQTSDAVATPIPSPDTATSLPITADATEIRMPENLVPDPLPGTAAVARTEKAARTPKAEPAISQMGFDF